MKFLLILSIFAIYSASALPFSINYLEEMFGPYNQLRFGPDSRIVGGEFKDGLQVSKLASIKHYAICI